VKTCYTALDKTLPDLLLYLQMHTIAYVYKWTHIPTLNWYVGARWQEYCRPTDSYICSSRYVKPLIQQKPEEWKREIIATGTPKEIQQLEMDILHLFDAKNDPRSYNRTNGGGIFGRTKGCKISNTENYKKAAQKKAQDPKWRAINKGRKLGPMKESAKQKLREIDRSWSIGKNSWWAKLEHKPTVSCLKCRREVGFNILGKHQWGSRCKEASKALKQ